MGFVLIALGLLLNPGMLFSATVLEWLVNISTVVLLVVGIVMVVGSIASGGWKVWRSEK